MGHRAASGQPRRAKPRLVARAEPSRPGSARRSGANDSGVGRRRFLALFLLLGVVGRRFLRLLSTSAAQQANFPLFFFIVGK